MGLFAAIGVGVVASIWFLHLFFLDTYYEEMKIAEVDRIATSISRSYQKNEPDLTQSIQELSVSNDFYVMMESSNGILLFSPESESQLPVYSYLEKTSKLKTMLKDNSSSPVSFKMDTGLSDYQTLAYGRKVKSPEGEAVYLYIFSPLYPVSSTVNILRHQLVYVTILSLIHI